MPTYSTPTPIDLAINVSVGAIEVVAGDREDADLRLPAAFPVTVLLDADGRVVFKKAIEIESLDQAHDLVEEHLGLTL